MPAAHRDIDTRKILHGERSHRHSPFLECRIHLARRCAFFQQQLRLSPVNAQHAVPDKPGTIPGERPPVCPAVSPEQARSP